MVLGSWRRFTIGLSIFQRDEVYNGTAEKRAVQKHPDNAASVHSLTPHANLSENPVELDETHAKVTDAEATESSGDV